METGPRGIPSDPYEVLGVQPGASAEEIARAYRRLLRQVHPDTSPHADPHVDLDAARAAYALLRDAGRRTAEAARAADVEPPPAGSHRRRAHSRRSTEWLWVGPVVWEPSEPHEPDDPVSRG
ncbi:MAG TPA: J domain-containing protein [Dermatophilaceae bacterium]|jgi:curved DNA-binding protein CbpA|nr:J domain-containing protein [Dermatophilaceae bacterium]